MLNVLARLLRLRVAKKDLLHLKCKAMSVFRLSCLSAIVSVIQGLMTLIVPDKLLEPRSLVLLVAIHLLMMSRLLIMRHRSDCNFPLINYSNNKKSLKAKTKVAKYQKHNENSYRPYDLLFCCLSLIYPTLLSVNNWMTDERVTGYDLCYTHQERWKNTQTHCELKVILICSKYTTLSLWLFSLPLRTIRNIRLLCSNRFN